MDVSNQESQGNCNCCIYLEKNEILLGKINLKEMLLQTINEELLLLKKEKKANDDKLSRTFLLINPHVPCQ